MADTPKPVPEKKPPEFYEEMDKRAREKESAAPTTKKDMGKVFKSGGKVRGHGVEQRGKTKGRFV